MNDLLARLSIAGDDPNIQHNVAAARRKVENEFKAIGTIRENWTGASMRATFDAWVKWGRDTQHRRRRDLRYEWRRKIKGFQGAMESDNIAQAQVDLWVRCSDSYTDTAFWKHTLTEELTWEKPTIFDICP